MVLAVQKPSFSLSLNLFSYMKRGDPSSGFVHLLPPALTAAKEPQVTLHEEPRVVSWVGAEAPLIHKDVV